MVMRRGSGSGGCLTLIALAAAVIAFGVPAAKVYLRAYEYAMRQVILYSKGEGDEGMQSRMRASADSIGELPDGAYDINVLRRDGMIRLSATYTDTIMFPIVPRPVTHRFSVERPE